MLNDSVSYLIHAPDMIINGFLQRVYPSMTAEIAPVISMVAILYWVVWGYRLYAGNTPFDAQSLLIKAGVTTMVFSLLKWQDVAYLIYQSCREMVERTISLALSHGQNSSSILDHVWKDIGQIAAFLMQNQSIGIVLQGYGLMLLNCAFVVMVVVYLVFAKMGLAVTIVLLPLFVIFFFFTTTRYWAFNWITSLLQCCLLFIFVHLLLHLSCLSYRVALDHIHDANHALLTQGIDVTTTAYVYIIEGLFFCLMMQTKAWSFSLAQSASTSLKHIPVPRLSKA